MPRSRTIRKFLLPLLILAASGGAVFWMVTMESPAAAREMKAPVLLVDTIEARKRTLRINVKAQGVVSPRTETTLVSEVSGLITEVSPSFETGGFFKRGDVLIRIDDRNYRAEEKRAEAAVASARTRLATETGLADHAKSDWDALRQRDGDVAERAASDLALRKPQLAEAEASLEYALSDLYKRRGDLERTVIRAPYDGLVKAKRVDLGQFVGAGTQLAVTYATDYAEVRLPLPDNELGYIDLPDVHGDEPPALPHVELTATLGGERHTWHGDLVRTEGVFDERSRVLFVVAQVKDPYGRAPDAGHYPLRFGTFVEASIEGRFAENVVLLARGSLRPGNQVWVVDENDTLRSRQVSILRADEDYVYIQSGLDDGQLVCVTPLENPLPGTRVRFSKPEPEAQLSLGAPR